MAYKISVDMPNLAKGAEVFIDGLGTFKNGESVVVSAEQVTHFRNAHGRVNDVGQWEQGPTLGQANIPGLTAERVSDREESGSSVEQKSVPAPRAAEKKEGDK